MQVTYAYPLVPVANFLSAILTLIPLPWLLQHWNTGAWTHAIWSALLCFINGVNTILWADNVEIKAVVWCDIAVRVFHAGSLAVITTNFVMARRVCLIMHIESPISASQRRKAMLFDLFVSIGIPVISIALSWFVEGHRFTIIEGEGCIFAYYVTPVYVALYAVWSVIFAALSAIYGAFIFRALIRRRNALREVSKVDPEISLEQFRRVIALGCTECLFTLPCALYVFISNVSPGVAPWKGLSDAHYGFSVIWQLPASIMNRRDGIIIQWNNWVTVFVSVVFFLFFGFSKAMWNDYRKGMVAFAMRFDIRLPARIIRAPSPNEQKNFVPPMVFHICTTLQTSATQSHVTSAVQAGVLDTRIRPESSVNELDQVDLEKGILVITANPSLGNPEDKIRREDDFKDDVLVEPVYDVGRSPSSISCTESIGGQLVTAKGSSTVNTRQ